MDNGYILPELLVNPKNSPLFTFECQIGIHRGSVSSEDIGSVRSGDASDSHQEDSLSTVTAGSGTAELSRAGSRRPVYLTEDSDSIPTRDVGPDPLDNQVG